MNSTKITAAFFGGFINCYNQAGEVVDFKYAFCSDEFAGQEFFNQTRKPALPALVPFVDVADMVEQVQHWPNIDVLVVAGFAYRLPIEVIKRFKWVINVHPGDLFTNRGATPLAHDLLQKNPFLTASIHLIDSERFDSGPFIASTKFPARYDKSFMYNMYFVEEYGGSLLKCALARLVKGLELPATQWVPAEGSYKPRVPQDVITKMVDAACVQQFHDQQ